MSIAINRRKKNAIPTLAAVRQRVDDWLTARWPTVQARQTAYAAAHGGRYWQGIRSMSGEPLHTTTVFVDTVSDLLSGHPTDQVETWIDFLPEISALAIPAVVIFDVYQDATSWGYVATVMARYNGTLYARSQNVGPQSDRTQAWHEIILA